RRLAAIASLYRDMGSCPPRSWVCAGYARGWGRIRGPEGVRRELTVRERDAAVVGDVDEAVSLERLDGLSVGGGGSGCDRAERLGAPLPERPLEPRLAPKRVVAGPARRAGGCERAGTAPRDPREADRRAEVEERLGARAVEVLAGALLDAADVRVHGEDLEAEREVP